MRRAAAGLALAAALVGALGSPVARALPDRQRHVARPPIVWRPIPLGHRRRQQMGAYSGRHYGSWTWRLTGPKVIVEHYTDGPTFAGAWATFAANTVHLG